MSVLNAPSLFMFYGQDRDADGTQLSWPGGPTGLPIRGELPGAITQEEYDSLPVGGVYRVKIFYTDSQEDMALYTEIRCKDLHGYYVIRERIVRWDEERKCERIFLEWAELAHGVPRGRQSAMRPMEGPSYAVNGPYAVSRRVFDPAAGVPPGMQLEQVR